MTKSMLQIALLLSVIATAVLGWHPWSVVRVIGFVMIGVVVTTVSGLLLQRVERQPGMHRAFMQHVAPRQIRDAAQEVLAKQHGETDDGNDEQRGAGRHRGPRPSPRPARARRSRRRNARSE